MRVVAPASSQANAPIETFGELVAHRVSELTDYQNAAYAARYSRLVEKASAAEQKRTPVQHGFADTVARYAYKLMAYKDEYEVARLYSRPEFKTALEEAFDGPYRLQFHLAPPLLTPKDPETGLATKRTFGGWMLPLLKVLARSSTLSRRPARPVPRARGETSGTTAHRRLRKSGR